MTLPPLYDGVYAKGKLWATISFAHFLLQLDPATGAYDYVECAEDGALCGPIAQADGLFWIAERVSGDLLSWDPDSGEKRRYAMPEGFRAHTAQNGVQMAHSQIICTGDWIVTLPGYANGMVVFNRKTEEIQLVAEDFWEYAGQQSNGYDPRLTYAGSFIVKLSDKEILAARMKDSMLLRLNVGTGECLIYQGRFSEKGFRKFMEAGDGFEQIGQDSGFVCYESPIFSLDWFADLLGTPAADDIRERQMQTLTNMSANFDGSTGERVKEAMLDIMETKI